MFRSSPARQQPAFHRWPVVGLLLFLATALPGTGVLAQTTNTPPAGYTLCAAERGQCSFSGTANVVYGSGTRWTTPRSFVNGVTCNNATFGDPTPFVVKSCYQRATDANTPPAGYTQCAEERGQCSFSGTANVVYGSGSRWTAPRSFVNSVTCNNATFGDPTPYAVKSCYQRTTEANTPPAGYTLCAAERGLCSFSGTASVVYGSGTRWTAPRSFTGSVACNNATFGDPTPLVVKACYTAATTGPEVITRDQAARFLAQATFGPTDADIDRLMAIGYAAWIDEQFATPRSGSHVAFFDELDTAGDANDKEVISTFWKNALTGRDQLRLRTAYALSQIFVISLEDGDVDNHDRAVAAWLDLLNANSFGNYRELLEQVSLNPMMGIYLSHIANQKADAATGRVPDENYAREVMQLFSIGLVELDPDGRPRSGPGGAAIETYTPADVSELAKVFTGWSWVCPAFPDRGCFLRGESNGQQDPDRALKPMVAYPAYHSPEAKTFLGTTIPAGTGAAESLRIALDRLAAHPNVGPFIGRQLIQRFTTSNPSPAYVNAVATKFNNNGAGVRGDLKAVIKEVLMHPEARAVSDTSGKVREPVLRLSAFMRAFPHRSVSGRFDILVTTNPATALGQAPLHAPSVFNFYRPGYVAPQSESAARNLVAPELQIVNETTAAGYVNFMRDSISAGVGLPAGSGLNRRDMQGDYSTELALANDAPALVDRVTTRLTYGALGAARRAEIVAAVNAIAIPGGSSSQAQIDAARRQRVNAAILLTVVAPEFVVIR